MPLASFRIWSSALLLLLLLKLISYISISIAFVLTKGHDKSLTFSTHITYVYHYSPWSQTLSAEPAKRWKTANIYVLLEERGLFAVCWHTTYCIHEYSISGGEWGILLHTLHCTHSFHFILCKHQDHDTDSAHYCSSYKLHIFCQIKNNWESGREKWVYLYVFFFSISVLTATLLRLRLQTYVLLRTNVICCVVSKGSKANGIDQGPAQFFPPNWQELPLPCHAAFFLSLTFTNGRFPQNVSTYIPTYKHKLQQ